MLTIPYRWSDNDRRWGPFIWATDSKYRPLAVILKSSDDEDRPTTLRLSGFGCTLIVWMPPIIQPWRQWVDTSRYEWSKGPGSGFWDVHPREYGFSYGEGHLSVRLGRQTHDSSTEQSWGCFLPWTQWRHVRHSLYDLEGALFAHLPAHARWNTPEYAEQERLTEACPTRTFAVRDYDGEELTVTTKIEEREWRFGTGWFKWLSLFRRPKVRRSLDLRFSGETGKRKGSWKGGTLGHGINMRPGELHAAAFERYCGENGMTYVGPVLTNVATPSPDRSPVGSQPESETL
jgi:hypothetical protein